MAESVGASIYNLRSEDNEKYRSGYKVTKPVEEVVRESEIAEKLRKTPEFQSITFDVGGNQRCYQNQGKWNNFQAKDKRRHRVAGP